MKIKQLSECLNVVCGQIRQKFKKHPEIAKIECLSKDGGGSDLRITTTDGDSITASFDCHGHIVEFTL